ncbi:complement decay-accelerating factor isoform X3 [Colossoma macropomum]|uniref:complement decay-accelerating factor isoform X3 n=1 Tax=Colossoma macropomum TaxID=42526 RepID=UPI0018648C39|nr:complement decay-accelerating factor isoform X3 [Colossoma macropomum]
MVRSKMSLWTLCLLFLASVSRGKAAECSKPVPTGNVVLTDDAILKNDFPDGSEVTVECANGYVMEQGSDIITCTDGAWSTPQLICRKRDCGSPKPAPNITYVMPDGTLFGARIKPVCDRGYFLQGSSSRQCLATGWSGRSRCEIITCAKPTEISDGMIIRRPVKDYPEFEDTIEYSCNPGYTLIGSKSIFCQDDGEYNEPPPMCLDISTTVRYPETTETTDTVFRVDTNRNSTTTAPSDVRGLDYEPSSTVAGTRISGYTTEIAVFSLVFAGFLVIGLVSCLYYFCKRKGVPCGWSLQLEIPEEQWNSRQKKLKERVGCGHQCRGDL